MPLDGLQVVDEPEQAVDTVQQAFVRRVAACRRKCLDLVEPRFEFRKRGAHDAVRIGGRGRFEGSCVLEASGHGIEVLDELRHGARATVAVNRAHRKIVGDDPAGSVRGGERDAGATPAAPANAAKRVRRAKKTAAR
ncbi:hypothetical protein [Burkholderia sp. Bp9099]|uniref:hypothetical protein n=1 Tax=Burkholderia sp. Bp9099 TaxID=2184568 RepID=UPI000F5F19BC|nr:hypothetical protein [Burkholderia sp. Bp9099]